MLCGYTGASWGFMSHQKWGYKGPSSGYGAIVVLTPAVNAVATPTIRIGRSRFTKLGFRSFQKLRVTFCDPQNKDYTVNMKGVFLMAPPSYGNPHLTKKLKGLFRKAAFFEKME